LLIAGGFAMKDDARDFRSMDSEGSAAAAGQCRAEKDTGRATSRRNWAWAPSSESYDWMDSAGSFSTVDLDD
jgi:hypothetical protein